MLPLPAITSLFDLLNKIENSDIEDRKRYVYIAILCAKQLTGIRVSSAKEVKKLLTDFATKYKSIDDCSPTDDCSHIVIEFNYFRTQTYCK